MDLLLSLSGLALLICLYFSTSFLLRRNHPRHNYKTPLPNGSFGWPWLGESLKFIAAARKGKPECFILDRILKGTPHKVFKTRLFGSNVAVLCGTEGNKLVFSSENKLVVQWVPRFILKLFLVMTDQFPSFEMKRLFSNLVKKPESLLAFVPVMDQCARYHMDAYGAWEPAEYVEAFKACKSYTFWVACRLLLSIDPQEDPAVFASLSNHVTKFTMGMSAIPINFPGTTYYNALNASKELRRKIVNIVEKRKHELAEGGCKAQAQPTTDDILTRGLLLISTKDEDQARENFKNIKEEDFMSGIVALLVASHDTTSTVMTFVLKYLAELPHAYENVYEEQIKIANSKSPGELLSWEDIQKMRYTWNVVCEVMRLTPPIQGTFRQAITDFVFDGFQIPKGWKVYWNAHSTHRDAKYFPEPEKFDPTRFEGTGPAPYSYVPFGGGQRMCPGNEYARILILVFLHNIVTRFKWEQLIPNEKMSVLAFPFPVNGLPLRMVPHNKS